VQHKNNTNNPNTIPAEALPHTYEAFIHRVRPRTLAVYWLVLLFLVAAFAALPFVYLSVDVSAAGTLAPVSGRHELFAPVSGRLAFARMQDNQAVRQGELLASIENTAFAKRKNILGEDLLKLQAETADLSTLIRQGFATTPDRLQLKTATYQLAYRQALRRFTEKSTQTSLVLKAYQRQKALYEADAIAAKDMEQETLRKEEAEDQLLQIGENYQLEWQTVYEQKITAIQNLKSTLIELNDTMDKLHIKAPISGTLQVPVGITQGVFVSAGSLLARLSPDTLLIAECYVSPSDIGLIKMGQSVRFQVSAFNYNEWGFLKGQVTEISHDVVLTPARSGQAGNQPMFKVRCSIDQNHLLLKNGYKGYLKKGMTLQGRFLIAERSLYHLLFDKVDDWLNPYVD